MFKQLQCFPGQMGRVWNVCWNPEGNTLVCCGEEKVLRVWAIENFHPFNLGMKTILTGAHDKTIRQVSWSPCGKRLAAASFDGTVSVWSADPNFECTSSLEGHESEVKSVCWSSSGQYLATGSRDKSVWIWERLSDDEYECAAVLNAHLQDVKKVVWSPTSDVLASASYDNTIRLFRNNESEMEWEPFATLSSHESTVWSIAFNKDGDRLVSCSADKTIKIWQQYLPDNIDNVPTPDNEPVWQCVCTLSGCHSEEIYDVSWCPLTNIIATASGDNCIGIFKEDFNSDRNEPSFSMLSGYNTAHPLDVNTVAWNPKYPGILASGSDDGDVKLWQFEDPDRISNGY